MDDSEFDKLFADKMRQTSAPDFSDEDWERLSPALDAAQRRRWQILPLWWLGALGGLLLCSNIAWWWMWQQSEKRSDAMRAEWQQTRRESVKMRDTSWSKVIVYQYDTIYRTLVYRTTAESIPQAGSVVLGQENATQSLSGKTAAPEHASNAATPTGNLLSNLDPQNIPLDTTGQSLKIAPITGRFDMLPIDSAFLKMPVRPFKLNEKDFVMLPLKRSHTPGYTLLIPKKFRAGAGAGLLIPSAKSLSGNSGYLFGLNGEIAFSDQLALTLEGAYCEVGFTGNEYDEGLGIPLPNPPGDDYVIKYFKLDEGFKPIVQLTTGMRYWLRATHRVSPYLGLGYAMQWHPSFELQFEYTNKFTGQDKERSIEVPALSRPVSLLDVNAGVRYRFWRHFSLQTGAFYQVKIENNQPGIPRFWGIKSSVLYEF